MSKQSFASSARLCSLKTCNTSAMATAKTPAAGLEPGWDKIQLAAKVIGHISQGMYRSPSGAIKELISNAYDAGATLVKIHTGFPRFAEFTCVDNGSGIEIEDFNRLMHGGIGDSQKDPSVLGPFDRPIIGRLGVGMLSLAQVCSEFLLISHHAESETAFEATIRFPAYTREEIDKKKAEAEKSEKTYIESGTFKLSVIRYEKRDKGVKITSTYMRETFRKTMQQLEKLAYFQKHGTTRSYPTFADFVECITDQSALYFASRYDLFLYGLALAAPLPYIEGLPKGDDFEPVLLKIPELRALQDTLIKYNFAVEVDNMPLRRPLVLPSNKANVTAAKCSIFGKPEELEFKLTDSAIVEIAKAKRYFLRVDGSPDQYQLYYFDYSSRVNGRTIAFSGYIFTQTSRLFPKEFQGVLIRLRNIAISEYDGNLMTYPLAEGPRFSMLSSEIFVRSGLDDALKVDRDGFNTLDPHYLRLQAFLHSILHEEIFPGSWHEEKKRNFEKRETQKAARAKGFNDKLTKTTNSKLRKITVNPDRVPEANKLVEVNRSAGTVTINEGHPIAKRILGKKKYRDIARQILTAFEVANQKGTPEKRREIFYKLIENIFNE